ncbi:MAG TPA: hypothetical protein VNL95_01470 [Dehalococcoidia bacterium]|nr:hypothetical protein [Dehalococcoidia bacterium]
MEWAVLGLFIVFLFIAYVIVQGTRGQLAYRKAIAQGDVDVIREVVDQTLEQWRSMKRPKEVPPNVWRGIQGMELVSLDAAHIRVGVSAEGEFRLVNGRWQEVSSPLDEAMAITAKALEMLLYDIPNVRLPWATVDVYTTFRGADGRPERRCILTTTASRQAARNVDWDNWPPAQIVSYLEGRYRLDEHGRPLPIQPEGGPQGNAEAGAA